VIELQRVFREKSRENLEAAEDDFVSRRYNSCASRVYYACFQAAVVALAELGIRPPVDQWSHGFVQTQFAGELVNRRHRYAPSLRDVLSDNLVLRQRAHYRVQQVSEGQASRALRRGREILAAIHIWGGARMSAESTVTLDDRTREAIDELKTMIRDRYPRASFAVSHGEDPKGIYLDATVDIDDVDDILDVVRDRLFTLQVDEGLPIYVIPLEPEHRVLGRLEAHAAEREARLTRIPPSP
jgi:uncharacterized protein (UPF0332 family)